MTRTIEPLYSSSFSLFKRKTTLKEKKRRKEKKEKGQKKIRFS